MDRKRLRDVALTILIILAAFGAWQGIKTIKEGDRPGLAAAQYLDALIRLGKLPTMDAVVQSIAQAQARPAPKDEPAKPAPKK